MRCLLLLCFLSAGFVGAHAGTLDKLQPRPKTGYMRTGVSLTINRNTPLRVVNDPRVERAYAFLQKQLKAKLGDTLMRTSVDEGTNGILLVVHDTMPAVRPKGYTLDVNSNRIEIAAVDADGFFNSITTLMQLLQSITVPPMPTLTAPGVWIWDAPDYVTRWVYSGLNLLSQGPALRSLLDTMSMLKLNGLQHADWNYSIINVAQPRVLDTIPVLRNYADTRNIEIIPTVLGQGWSSNILYQNPNLATGFPAKARYTMVADSGVLIVDSRVALPNGGFETLGSNGQFTGWGFYDGPGFSTFPDNTIKRSGAQSARIENFAAGNPSGNARFSRTMPCDPFTQYSMDCYIKTEGYKGGFFQLLAIGKDAAGATRTLTFTSFDIPQTSAGSGWIHAEARFNTLEFTQVILYAGVWGGSAGKVWIDDFSVWPSGMCNVLRREGAPVWVKNATTGRIYTEGVDYQTIVDPTMLGRKGNYGRYHRPPVPRRIATGAINNGDVLDVTFSHPLTTVADTAVQGSTMNTMSNDTVYTILSEQARLVNQHLEPQSVFLGHDEIRAFNRDSGDIKRNLTPRQMLGKNINWCDSVVRALNPDVNVYIWNDMIDSTHNAINNYYLVNGDLRGIWNDIPKNIIVANWIGSKAAASLSFMSKQGFKQITCPYYDVGDASSIRSRRIIQDTIPGILGSMYTTWANDYTQLRAFASYMWHAGPFIEHKPLTKAEIIAAKPPTVSATITHDPFDNTDRITTATVEFYSASGIDKQMMSAAGSTWSAAFAVTDTIRYRICATNTQGLTQCTPWYQVVMSDSTPDTTTTVEDNARTGALSSIAIAPNPVLNSCTIRSAADMHLVVVRNIQGVEVMRVILNGEREAILNCSVLASGAYHIDVDGMQVMMVKQ